MAVPVAARRGLAISVQFALALLASTSAYVAAAISNPAVAHALVTPTAVTEYQPNLNATNSGAPANHAKWGGRTLAVDVDPTDANTAITGTESGGLFKTTDGGATWSHLDGLPTFQLEDLRFAPNDHNTVIATTWQTSDTANPGGLFRSTNGGATWARPNLPSGCNNNFFAWGMDFEPGTDNAYVGADCGLLFSTDRGANWSRVNIARVHAVVAQAGAIVDVCAGDGHHRFTLSGGVLTAVGGASPINGGGCPFLGNYRATQHNITAAPQESGVLFAMSSVTSTTLCGGTVAQPAGLWGLFESDDAGVNWTRNGAACASREPWVRATRSRDGVANHFDLYYSGGLDITRVTCTTGGPGLRCAGLSAAPNVGIQHADPNYLAFQPGTNCPEYAVLDGGAEKTSDCGANFTQVAGSGAANGNYNALQIYDIAGQVHPGHTDLYFGTQDNDNWASPDNGATWPVAACCEGFFYQTPLTSASDSGQTISFVTCAGCGNLKASAHFAGCNYNPACSAWPNPSGSSPGPDSGAPRVIEDKVYVQWSQSSGTNQLNLTTNAGGAWSAITNATTTQALMSHPFVTGPAATPTIYQPVCTNSCGFIAPSGTVLKITGARTSSATVTTVNSGIGTLGTYNDGVGSWLIQEVAFGADPNNPNHLIAADVNSSTMKVSTDGGSTWTTDQQLTNFVTGFGRYTFTIPVFGTQVHAIAFDPNNGNHILVGTHEAGIVASIDGGTTWTTVLGSRQIPNVTAFFFDNVQNDILVSSFGRGIWKLDATRRAATIVNKGATSGDFNDTVTLAADLYDTAGGPSSPIQGAVITFTLGSQSCTGTTNANGRASCTLLLNQTPGAYSLVESFAGNAQWLPTSTTTPFTILREDTQVTYTGDTTQDFHDPATMSGHLFDPSDGLPIAGKVLTFTLGVGDSCTSPPTDSAGNASCVIVPTQPAGPTPLVTSFAGDAYYLPAATTTTFVITREETTTTYTGPTVIANGVNTTFSGVLKEDGTVPIAGRALVFTLGSGITQQNCTGITDASGSASCSILVNQPLGPGSITVAFLGDAFYLPSSDTKTTILFGFLDRGAFVIGDGNVQLVNPVYFWGAQWADNNTLSGGPAPNAFKGFASKTTEPPACGVAWTWAPGNSGDPPDSVPAFMGVIVSSSVTKKGATTSGDTVEIVVVKTDPGYAGNPGHPGTGMVVGSPSDSTKPAVFCHS